MHINRLCRCTVHYDPSARSAGGPAPAGDRGRWRAGPVAGGGPRPHTGGYGRGLPSRDSGLDMYEPPEEVRSDATWLRLSLSHTDRRAVLAGPHRLRNTSVMNVGGRLVRTAGLRGRPAARRDGSDGQDLPARAGPPGGQRAVHGAHPERDRRAQQLPPHHDGTQDRAKADHAGHADREPRRTLAGVAVRECGLGVQRAGSAGGLAQPGRPLRVAPRGGGRARGGRAHPEAVRLHRAGDRAVLRREVR